MKRLNVAVTAIALAGILLSFSGGFTQEVETGVVEKLGNTIPLDLWFVDDHGDSVLLRDVITRPTILSLVYFRCPGICSPLLSGIVEVLEQIEERPGVDYQVLTVSFDDTDTPVLAAQKKKNYLKSFHQPFPESEWRFLTSDSAAIHALTEAVGFKFKRQGSDFIHPGLITILSADGKVTRYLYGISFLPFDIKMGLLEAAQGRTGPTINRVLLYCFSYDPQGKKYAFNFLKVTGTVVIFLVLVFVGFLVVTSRARSRKARSTNG